MQPPSWHLDLVFYYTYISIPQLSPLSYQTFGCYLYIVMFTDHHHGSNFIKLQEWHSSSSIPVGLIFPTASPSCCGLLYLCIYNNADSCLPILQYSTTTASHVIVLQYHGRSCGMYAPTVSNPRGGIVVTLACLLVIIPTVVTALALVIQF